MFEEIPDLPFRLILRDLSYEDRFSLRRTCKKLKNLVDGQVCRKLFVFLDCYPCNKYLFKTDELVYYPDSCRVPDFERFLSSKHKASFKSLRKLTIFFEGLYKLRDYLNEIEINLNRLRHDPLLRECWCLKINLEHLNFFEELEHLEIKGIGRVFGRLRLKSLKVLSVGTRRLSEFDLDCEQLKAMCISFAARPNFVGQRSNLDLLSTKLLYGEGTFDYLHRLFGQCTRLSIVGFEYPAFCKFTLTEVNAGRISLPHLRVINFERPQFSRDLDRELIVCLARYEKSIEPESLQIIFNDEPISVEQLAEICRICRLWPDDLPKLPTRSLNKLLKWNGSPNTFNCFFLGINRLVLSDADLELDEDLVTGSKHLQELSLFSGLPRVDETLFRRMLSTWTQVRRFFVDNPSEQVGQHLLELMPGYWPNLLSLVFGEKPDDLRFVTEFVNLKALSSYSNLPREDTMLLLQTCPSLYYINFHNKSTEYFTVLHAKNCWKHVKCPLVFPKYFHRIVNRYKLYHFPGKGRDRGIDEYLFPRSYSSLEKLVDYYYQKDLYNKRRIGEFPNIKRLIKS